jgi:hypothetical protein
VFTLVTPAYKERDREKRLDFLDDFFAKASQRDRLLRDFEKRCL